MAMRTMRHLATLTVVVALAACVSQGAVLRVKPDAPGPHTGQSWDEAFATVSESIAAAASGDEIWVARGTYQENLAVPSGVALFGGFAGTENLRQERDLGAHPSVLDGGLRGSVVVIPNDAASETRVDGFTITGGSAIQGGGVNIGQRAAAVIVNNRITGNSALSSGGGVFCNLDCTSVIANNWIGGNAAITAGGGICTETGAPVVASNVIAGNSAASGGGIFCGDPAAASSERISNNTITGNSASTGGGLYLASNSSGQVSNNIIAFNASGIQKEAGSGNALRSNCVYGNRRGDYTGITKGATDIAADPLLASLAYGNLHIQPGSPCRNAGDNTKVEAGTTDMDGQTRMQGAVDIGADESDGASWSVTPLIVRAAPDGSDSNDGSSWAQPRKTIQAAIEKAGANGGQVWVKSGTYFERILLRDFVYVYGGFSGVETALDERNPAANATILDASQQGPVVTARFMGDRLSALDGFTVRGGRAQSGAGVLCDNASPILANNTVTGNAARGKGGGIYLLNSTSDVRSNTVSGNSAMEMGGGIGCDRSAADISANAIVNNSAPVSACGVWVSSDSSPALVNNRLTGNREDLSMPGAWGGGVSADSYSSADLINNTISDNQAYGAIYCAPFGALSVRNSIIAFNASGICADSSASVSSVRYNCVYGNTGFNYRGLAAGTGDIALDPLFENASGGDYGLVAGSTCIDKADAALAPARDIETTPRPLDGDGNLVSLPDIGAFEYARSFITPRASRALPDGALVAMTGLVSTAVWPGLFYAGSPDGFSGIGVTGAASGTGRAVTVEGSMTTVSGERMVSPYNVIEGGAAALPPAWSTGMNALGGGPSGLQEGVSAFQGPERTLVGAGGVSDIGLRVVVWGRVTASAGDGFYLDDGSRFDEGDPLAGGVKVSIPSGVQAPPAGSFLKVIGISACYRPGAHLFRLVRVSRAQDIAVLVP